MREGVQALCDYPKIIFERINCEYIRHSERVLQLMDVVVNKISTVTPHRVYSTEGNAGALPSRGGAF